MASPFEPNEEVEIPLCPICGGKLEVVYDRYHQHVAVCADCMTGLTIPGKARLSVRRSASRKETLERLDDPPSCLESMDAGRRLVVAQAIVTTLKVRDSIDSCIG
jgi:hypothetical protein